MEATRIVIAHRLSTIINADKICYLEGGQIVEMGTYEELMEKDGMFAELASGRWRRDRSERDRSPFCVLRSPFIVHRSSFVVRRSSFVVRGSPFVSSVVRRT